MACTLGARCCWPMPPMRAMPRVSPRIVYGFLSSPLFRTVPLTGALTPKIETRRIAALDRSRESYAKHFRSAARADEKKERERERERERASERGEGRGRGGEREKKKNCEKLLHHTCPPNCLARVFIVSELRKVRRIIVKAPTCGR